MARLLFIPITDDGDECSSSYTVRYRVASESTWTTLDPQYGELFGSPAAFGIVIHNLEDDTIYQVGITRNCCNGTSSSENLATYDTTLPS